MIYKKNFELNLLYIYKQKFIEEEEKNNNLTSNKPSSSEFIYIYTKYKYLIRRLFKIIIIIIEVLFEPFLSISFSFKFYSFRFVFHSSSSSSAIFYE